MTAAETLRRSPVHFAIEPVQAEVRDGWSVALEYPKESGDYQLIDLSHRQRLDVQDGSVTRLAPWGARVPDGYCECAFDTGRGVLVNRMNRTQASVWHLRGTSLREAPADSAYTDVTDATLFLGLLGSDLFALMERLTSLDLPLAARTTPRLVQGPLLHVPTQIVVLGRGGSRWGVAFTCSRGYGRTMIEGITHAGRDFDLRPAGERAFVNWLEGSELIGRR